MFPQLIANFVCHLVLSIWLGTMLIRAENKSKMVKFPKWKTKIIWKSLKLLGWVANMPYYIHLSLFNNNPCCVITWMKEKNSASHPFRWKLKSATRILNQKSEFRVWLLPKCFTYLLSCYSRTAKNINKPVYIRHTHMQNEFLREAKCMPSGLSLYSTSHMHATEAFTASWNETSTYCVTFWAWTVCVLALKISGKARAVTFVAETAV